MVNDAVVAGSLEVPGARLHYEVAGTGPLLAVVGLPMGCKGFLPITQPLIEHFTVLTFDPRGVHGSPADDPDREVDPALMADDVHRLIDAVGAGPAYVFASSGGGVTALELAARHPDQVRALVAHEPPLLELLPDRAELRVAVDEICALYREDRPAALKKYLALAEIRLHRPTPEPPPPGAFTSPWSVWTILDRLFHFTLRPMTRYLPNLDALRPVADRIVVAGGDRAREALFRRAAVALADRLGTPLVEFPGDHTGFLTDSGPFADQLVRVFTERSRPGSE